MSPEGVRAVSPDEPKPLGLPTASGKAGPAPKPTPPKKTCSRLGCANPGRWRPVLLLRANLKNRPAPGALKGLLICDSCKSLVKASDLIIDKAWDEITFAFKQLGRAVPLRVLTRLAWEEIQ